MSQLRLSLLLVALLLTSNPALAEPHPGTKLLKLEGDIVLRESPWDPIATLLPLREQVSTHLWTPTFLDRRITLAGKLDGEKFAPFADTIGGSRWPGEMGGPVR